LSAVKQLEDSTTQRRVHSAGGLGTWGAIKTFIMPAMRCTANYH